MFRTEHLEGRLLYETDKVVCINIHLNVNYDCRNRFISQVLLSLVNKKNIYFPSTINLNSSIFLTKEDFTAEVDEGISQYLDYRKKLELD